LLLGVVVAIFNYLSAGKIAGSGHAEVFQILNNKPQSSKATVAKLNLSQMNVKIGHLNKVYCRDK
jgi:hypothetical protein